MSDPENGEKVDLDLAMLHFGRQLMLDIQKYVSKEIREGKCSSQKTWLVMVSGRVQAVRKDIEDLEHLKLDVELGGKTWAGKPLQDQQ